jgi:hypothetical protein
MDNVAVFREYAASDIWTTVLLGDYFAAPQAFQLPSVTSPWRINDLEV